METKNRIEKKTDSLLLALANKPWTAVFLVVVATGLFALGYALFALGYALGTL